MKLFEATGIIILFFAISFIAFEVVDIIVDNEKTEVINEKEGNYNE